MSENTRWMRKLEDLAQSEATIEHNGRLGTIVKKAMEEEETGLESPVYFFHAERGTRKARRMRF